jgi:putative aldouronate transport system substrate-binding protein
MNVSMKKLIGVCLLVGLLTIAAATSFAVDKPYRFIATHSWDLAQGRIDFEDQPEDPVFQWLEKHIGIVAQSYCYDWEGGKGYIESVRLLLASGTLPEAILEPFELSFVKELYDLGILIPLDDLLEEHAPLVLAQYSEADLQLIRSLTPDGKIYYLPGKSIEPRQGMIRADWLREVGMDLPTTRDELVEVYKAFRDKDANGNGDPNDEVPVSGREGMRWLDDLFVMHGVHMYEGHPEWSWDPEKKQMISHQVSDNMKEAITFLRYLVEEDLMDKTMPIQPAQEWFAKIAADKVGHYFHLASGIERRLTMRESGENPDAEWVYLPNVEVPGVPHQKNFYPGIGVPSIVITTAAKDPGKILEWFNWGLTSEGKTHAFFGIEGMNYVIEDGKIVTEGYPAQQRYQYHQSIAQADAEVYLQTRYGEMKAAIYNASIDDGRPLEDLGMPLSVYEDYEDFIPNNMGSLYRQYCSKMVLGELPMSAWDEYVAEWNKRGGDVVTQRATEWYKQVHNIQ